MRQVSHARVLGRSLALLNYVAGLLISAIVIHALLTGSRPARAATAPTAEVKIDNFVFTPPVLMIAPGTTVKWTNHDDIPHAIAENAIAWKSRALDTGESFEHTFTTPGEVDYFCSLHSHMTGKIIVRGQ